MSKVYSSNPNIIVKNILKNIQNGQAENAKDILREFISSSDILRSVAKELIKFRNIDLCVDFADVSIDVMLILEPYIIKNANFSQLLRFAKISFADESLIVKRVKELDLNIPQSRSILNIRTWKSFIESKKLNDYIEFKQRESVVVTDKIVVGPNGKWRILPSNKEIEDNNTRKELKRIRDTQVSDDLKEVVKSGSVYKIYEFALNHKGNGYVEEQVADKIKKFNNPYVAYLFAKNVSIKYRKDMEDIVKRSGGFKEIFLFAKDIGNSDKDELALCLIAKKPSVFQICLFVKYVNIINGKTLELLEKEVLAKGTEKEIDSFYRNICIPIMKKQFIRKRKIEPLDRSVSIDDCCLMDLINRFEQGEYLYENIIERCSPEEVVLLCGLLKDKISKTHIQQIRKKVLTSNKDSVIHNYIHTMEPDREKEILEEYKKVKEDFNKPEFNGTPDMALSADFFNSTQSFSIDKYLKSKGFKNEGM